MIDAKFEILSKHVNGSMQRLPSTSSRVATELSRNHTLMSRSNAFGEYDKTPHGIEVKNSTDVPDVNQKTCFWSNIDISSGQRGILRH